MPRRLGAIRRSQLITTYGVGALIAVDNESFVIAGLDSWDVSEAVEIRERRLAGVLGVDHFRLPPAPDPDRGTDGVRVRRFPDYYSCPQCKALLPFRKFNSPVGEATCRDCGTGLVPSRFVLACDHGHLDDFPYWKWIHRGSEHSGGYCGGTLALTSDGSAASLRSVVVSCTCGVPEVSMDGAFRRQALRDLRIRCEGRSPWLRSAGPQTCTLKTRVMQRGSSSIWHPIVYSALTIPPWSEGLHRLVDEHDLLNASEETIRWYFSSRQRKLQAIDASVEDVIDLVRHLADPTLDESDSTGISAYAKLRHDEYESLRRENREHSSSELQTFVCERASGDLTPLKAVGVDDVMQVKRLREVRALAAFVRGATPMDADSDQRHARLAAADSDWLPAVEVSGEGVFLRLDQNRLRSWESNTDVRRRSDQIRDNHLRLLNERAAAQPRPDGQPVRSPVTPRFLLVHTLAHVLINEWSLDAGYPASALRERLYAGDGMAGLLIYTATSDSAGSLGGVVAQGELERLRRSLRSSLERASWCSNDPLCMESQASGTDNLNLAACHACVLLPETSCESNNCFLDRTLLIGDLGYFAV
ncbi:DrmB family protein [Catellatospora bangladeshensis]|uniref:DUF1998 domain-containing protein n=1 Tax=Catellatospora bangladeshensis TaxID=310355 RepID=UPI0019444432|nr:DUF1998 domain-containing protein [Catellatospora bangladeshensis]